MKFVTETRLKLLEDLLQSIPDREERSYAVHLLNAIRGDIDDNYAEIQRPFGLSGISPRMTERNNKYEMQTPPITLEKTTRKATP